MIVVSPACSDERLNLARAMPVRRRQFGRNAIVRRRLLRHARTCAECRALGAVSFPLGQPAKCVATASKRDKAAAKKIATASSGAVTASILR